VCVCVCVCVRAWWTEEEDPAAGLAQVAPFEQPGSHQRQLDKLAKRHLDGKERANVIELHADLVRADNIGEDLLLKAVCWVGPIEQGLERRSALRARESANAAQYSTAQYSVSKHTGNTPRARSGPCHRLRVARSQRQSPCRNLCGCERRHTHTHTHTERHTHGHPPPSPPSIRARLSPPRTWCCGLTGASV
jgi:hypothetical protein